MAVTLSQSEINDLAEVLGIGAVRENVEEGTFSADDGRAILTARGHTIEQITGVIPDDEGYGFIPDVVGSIGTATQVISSSVTTPLQDYTQLTADINGFVTDAVRDSIGSINAETERTAVEALTDAIAEIGRLNGVIDELVKGYEFLIGTTIKNMGEQLAKAEEESTNKLFGVITGGLDTAKRANAQLESDIRAVSDEVIIQGTNIIEDVEENVRGVATAIRDSLPEVAEKVMSGVESVTSGFPDLIGSVVEGIAKTFGLDNLVDMFKILGKVGDVYFNELDAIDLENPPTASWDTPIGIIDNINTLIMGLPFIGSAWAMRNSGDVERLRYNSLAHVEPTPLDQGSVLESYRRDPSKNDRISTAYPL